MNGLLKNCNRLLLYTPGNTRVHARLKEIKQDGSLVVTYGSPQSLAQGDIVEMRSADGSPAKIYYMQVQVASAASRPYLLLQHNPGASLKKRRRGWRIPFNAQTGIRATADHHFRSASFIDLSLVAARVICEHQFPPDTRIVLRVALPEFPEHLIEGKVLRTSTTPLRKDSFGQDCYGLVITFESMSATARKHLTFFLWRQVRRIFPREMRKLYDITHRKQSGD